MCIDWVSKVRFDKIARCLSVWGHINPAGIKLQYFCQYGDRQKNQPKNKIKHIYILDTIESESTTRFKNRSSDRMMTSDWLVDVSDDRYTTMYYVSFPIANIVKWSHRNLDSLNCQTMKVKPYTILNTSRKHVNYEKDKNKVPMNKPYNIQNTNICNGIFHIAFFKVLHVLINEGEATRGRRLAGRNDPDSGGADANGLRACVVGR